MTGYIHVKEAAKLWNIGERQVSHLCKIGKVNGAVKQGRTWMIPVDAEKPTDNRVVSGEYKNWRRKNKVERQDVSLLFGIMSIKRWRE